MKVKFLEAGRIGPSSDFQWPEIGEWLHVKGPLEMCSNGIHVPAAGFEVKWIAEECYEIAVDGASKRDDDKHCYRSARLVRRLDLWNDRSQRLFAADCAEDVLHLVHLDERRVAASEAITASRLLAIDRISADAAALASANAIDATANACGAVGPAHVAAGSAAFHARAFHARVSGGLETSAYQWQSARLMEAMTNPAWTADRMAAVKRGKA